jgi:CobQ-like glutamine amidotransferase family enzyme
VSASPEGTVNVVEEHIDYENNNKKTSLGESLKKLNQLNIGSSNSFNDKMESFKHKNRNLVGSVKFSKRRVISGESITCESPHKK